MNTSPRIVSVLMLVLGCCVSSARAAGEDGPHRIWIILDTDANNELDDQYAIAYMLYGGDAFAVEGITVNRTSGGGGGDLRAQRASVLCGQTM